MTRQWIYWAVAGSALLCAGADAPQRATDQAALTRWQDFVGQWRGVGQPKRGSARGAWSEQCECQWQFDQERAKLVFRSENGKYFSQAELRPGEKENEFVWIGTLPDGETIESFAGATTDEVRLVLTAEEAAPDRPARITLRLVAGGDRLVVLYERQAGGTNRYTRLAEVGYTRRGSSFARGNSQPECVVTGGLGSMTVEHGGQTYYVCCTGCRDLFLEDPDGVLADYRQRKADEKNAAENGGQ